MTDNQTLQTDTCPNCQHQQHAPDVECEGLVNHNGDRHWHRCLCLKRAGADSSCHPLMTCQGGNLGYSDIWHLQRGHTLQGADGPVTPDVLTAVPVSSPPPDQTADRAAVFEEAIAALTRVRDKTDVNVAEYRRYSPSQRNALDAGIAELRRLAAEAPKPETPNTARAAVYREVADRLTTDAHGMQPDWARIYKRDAANKVREWAAEMAAERQEGAETRVLADQAVQDRAILARVRRLYESGPLGTCCAHLVGAALSGPGRAAATPEQPPAHKGGNADDCPACQAQGLHTIGHPYECPGSEK